ncbi:hypothetical protein Ancab_022829 [Ancistrocladus abbreviatus]
MLECGDIQIVSDYTIQSLPIQRPSLGAWRDRRSYKEVANSAIADAANKVPAKSLNAEAVHTRSSEFNTMKRKANTLVHVQVNIVEESSGKTIFARGDDRERAPKPVHQLNHKLLSATKGSGSSSVISCPLIGIKDYFEQGTPDRNKDSDDVPISPASLSRNDDSLNTRNSLG